MPIYHNNPQLNSQGQRYNALGGKNTAQLYDEGASARCSGSGKAASASRCPDCNSIVTAKSGRVPAHNKPQRVLRPIEKHVQPE